MSGAVGNKKGPLSEGPSSKITMDNITHLNSIENSGVITGKHPVFFDGMEMKLIEHALKYMAEKDEQAGFKLNAQMGRILAERIEAARVEFHARTYAQMVLRYELPQVGER
ncbi:hypothetical protein ACHHV8_33695 [Paenibacillus sp. TAB 01]|uniref:hypothetical protein n=1 Tax=Paenibacillus sp. TAB 01 TaxID=3368988 RepID=UPI0037530F85